MREAHCHIAAHGRSLSMVRLDRCVTRAEVLERVQAESARLYALGEPAAGEWVIAGGARVEGWDEPRWVTRRELDAAAGVRACVVTSFDHHSLAANSAALRAAGISDGEPDPPDGVTVRDASGALTGVMLESAATRVLGAMPEPGPVERRRVVRAGVADLARLGFTEAHDLLSQPWLGPVLAELCDAGELPLACVLYAPIAQVEDQAAAAGGAGGRAGWTRPGRVELAGGKVFADGTLNSRTALMLHPYRAPLPGLERGKAMVGPADLDHALARVARLGLGLAVHAIGDGAVRMVLDAAERHGGAGPRRAAPGWNAGWNTGDWKAALRIEHAELIDAADVPRFDALGVVASVQPCHLLADIEVLRRELPHRLDRVLPLRDLLDAGLVPGRSLVFGSDAPIVRPDPGDSLDAATLRRRPQMAPEQAIGWEQRITGSQARAAFGASP